MCNNTNTVDCKILNVIIIEMTKEKLEDVKKELSHQVL